MVIGAKERSQGTGMEVLKMGQVVVLNGVVRVIPHL